MKILVIDDEKPTLSMFRLFLAAYGYEVHTAGSGEEGLEVFHAVHPQIVFTDIRMPGMDGLEVLGRVRKADPYCQVIIITGHGDMDRALDALDMDASDFINKPVERQALNSALVRAEKRASRPGCQDFGLAVTGDGTRVAFGFRGRLSRGAYEKLSKAVTAVTPEQTILIDFHPEFSIDRQGLSDLTTVLQLAAERGIQVEMKGLSFNYIRFFEMAGIHKLAGIQPADPEEPGL